MFDPLTIGLAFKAMQAAYEGITYCCEALSEGKVAVQKIKKATEDAKTIVNDTKTIWSTIAGLFGIKPKSTTSSSAASSGSGEQKETKPVEKKKASRKEEYHIPNESEIVQQFIGHLGAFFRHHKELSEYVEIRYEEVFSSQDPNPEDILELSVYKNELDHTYVKLSGMMRGANVPPQLGPLWDNYNQIYSKVQAEQQKRKEQIRIKRQIENYKRERFRQEKIELGTGLFLVLVICTWLWAVWINSFTEGFS